MPLAPDNIVLHESLGDAHFHQGHYPQALVEYRAALHLESASALVLAKSGICEIHLGKRESGMQALQEALRREPTFPELFDVVVLGSALAQNNSFAANTACRRLRMSGTSSSHYALACMLLRLSGDLTMYQEISREGLAKFPYDQVLSAECGMPNL
jgi:predicted Zn-dependent protease